MYLTRSNYKAVLELIFDFMPERSGMDGHSETAAKIDRMKLLRTMIPLELRQAKDLVEAEMERRKPTSNPVDRVLDSFNL